jgi:hypothetical protein
MSRMLLLVALAGSIGADIDAIIVAFAGTFTGLTIPMPTPPAVRELKNKTGVSVVLVQLKAPSNRIKPIKLKDRDTMRLFIFNEINGKGRHLFQNPEIGISSGFLLSSD